MANLSAGGLSNFRRWYTQYKATHGTEPPSDLMDRYLSGEMEAEEARSQQSRQISLQEKSLENTKDYQEKSLENTKDYQDKSLAQRSLEFATQTKQQEEAQKSADQAAMVSGVKDIASLGIEAKRAGIFGGTKTTSPYMGSDRTNVADSSGVGGYTAPSSNPYTAGTVTSGLGGSSVQAGGAGYSLSGGAETGLDLSRYSLTEGGGTAIDASKYSMGGETSGAGTNWGSAAKGLGSAAAAAAIQASQPAVTGYITDKGGKDAGIASLVSADIGTGAAAGYGYGGGWGALIGAGVGLESGLYKGLSGETQNVWTNKNYGKTVGIASIFGLSSANVAGISKEYEKASPSTQKVADVLSGGVTKAIKKLKKLF